MMAGGTVFPSRLPLAALGSLLLLAGCGGPSFAPVSGTVYLDGQPLKFGSVMMQPPGGAPATAVIQPDGTYEMRTGAKTGATVGPNQVRITCFTSQDPAASSGGGEVGLGQLLIPKKYTQIETSGLEVEIKPGENTGVDFQLSSKP